MTSCPSPELKNLARILADWAAPSPNARVYLFGSRVRGDYRPDSDVDIHVDWSFVSEDDVEWWTHNNETDFADLKPRLPGPLKILGPTDPWAKVVATAGKKPFCQDRNVSCVWLPPKPK
jgi:hypothetical protein